jgi:hypothetical protein
MIAKCSICRHSFDSHNGGRVCCVCGLTVCPECEYQHFDDTVGYVAVGTETVKKQIKKYYVCLTCRRQLKDVNNVEPCQSKLCPS